MNSSRRTAPEGDLPALFLEGNSRANLDKGGAAARCLRCGKKIKGNPVLMYRDWRIHEFHDFGGIPDREHGAPSPYPDGPYEVGPDCAEAWRERARFYMEKANIALPASWLDVLHAAVAVDPVPVVCIGGTRTGKTRLASALQSAAGQLTFEVCEYHTVPPDLDLKKVHLVAFRQTSVESAAQLAASMGRQITPDEFLALPRWRCVLRIAGQAEVALVDASEAWRR